MNSAATITIAPATSASRPSDSPPDDGLRDRATTALLWRSKSLTAAFGSVVASPSAASTAESSLSPSRSIAASGSASARAIRPMKSCDRCFADSTWRPYADAAALSSLARLAAAFCIPSSSIGAPVIDSIGRGERAAASVCQSFRDPWATRTSSRKSATTSCLSEMAI